MVWRGSDAAMPGHPDSLVGCRSGTGMVTWNEFAWAAFLYGAIGGDRDYQALMRNTEFLQRLRSKPDEIERTEIRERVIEGFLNRWRFNQR